MGRFEIFMGRFGFGHGAFYRRTGRGSVLAARDSPPHWQRGRCPSRAAKFCAKLLADGVAKFCAKLSKQISRNHRLARPTRPTSPSAKREAQSLALHCSLQVAKLKAQRPQGVARRKVFRIGSTAFANFA